MKRLFISLVVLVFATSTYSAAWAQSDAEVLRAEYLQRVEELRLEREAARQEQLERAREIREAKAAEIEERKVQLRAELEERLTERAKERAEQVANSLNRVNDNVTDAMLNHLNALENALNALMARVDKISEGSGADLASTIAAADDAYARIAFARDAVLAQKEKVYTVEIDSVENVGVVFREVSKQLKDDLRILISEELRPAKEAVRIAFSELKAAIQEAREEHEGENDSEDEENELE